MTKRFARRFFAAAQNDEGLSIKVVPFLTAHSSQLEPSHASNAGDISVIPL